MSTVTKPSSLVFAHGGDGYDSYGEYLASIASATWAIAPYAGEKKRWKTRIFENLLAAGIPLYSPEFPCKNNAKYHEWKLIFELLMANIDDNAVYIGHSLGGNFLAKYFLESGKKAHSVHLVSPCYGLGGGFDLPDSLETLPKHIKEIHLWYSKDDKVVEMVDFEQYIEAIPGLIIHEFQDRGHFNQEIFPEMEEYIGESFA